MILDTAVTSEDLSHTTMKKIYVRKKYKQKIICTIVVTKFQKMTKIIVQHMYYAILYTTLSIYK